MMILFLSLCCSLSLAASLRTSIPKREGLAQDVISETKCRTLICPKIDGFPLTVSEERLLKVSLFAKFSAW